MLSKEVCMECRRRLYGVECNFERPWTEFDETEWRIGYVRCWQLDDPAAPLDSRYARINEPPPEGCPYETEHVVSQRC